MDYEKAYNKALEMAKSAIKDCGDNKGRISMIESIFPKLAESKDEKIRKALLDSFEYQIKESRPDKEWICGVKLKEIVAWLEKQGESYTKKDVDDAYLKGVTNTKNEIEKQYEANYQIRKDIATFIFNYRGDIKDRAKWMDYLGIKVSFVEKQGEQKVPSVEFKAKDWYVSKVDGKIRNIYYSVDNVEPKFHEGDWIINDQGSAFQIAYIDTENCRYVFEIGGYTKEEMNYENIAFANNHYRKWTIDDAKDGDVLYSPCCKLLWIYKDEKTCHVGSNLNYNSGSIAINKPICIPTDVHPATKEQRDLLFQKMKEAGYQWNPDKKELKLLISNGDDFESSNSKQKPVNDTVETIVEAVSNTSILDMIEDKDAFTNPGAFENSLGRLLKLFEKLPKQDLLDGLKFYTNVVEHDGEYVKPTKWSDEDENGFGDALWAINKARTIAKDENDMGNLWYAENWLKSLKERLS